MHRWSRAKYSLKCPREVGLIVETAFDGDLRKRHLSGLDETSRSLQAEPEDKLVRRQTERRAEESRKVKWTDVRTLGEGHQRHIVVQL